MTPTEIVLDFIDAINGQNVDKLVGLMTPDHKFTDSLGREIPGRRYMRDAWLGYFKAVPDYRIIVVETFTDGDRVMVVGSAGGTYTKDGELRPENRWQVPAAWRGQLSGHRVATWSAYIDHEPLRQIMLRESEPELA